jgi:hypothetical protein
MVQRERAIEELGDYVAINPHVIHDQIVTKVDIQRSNVVRAVGLKGEVDIEGKGSDIELENIAGQVKVNGSYSGTLQF